MLTSLLFYFLLQNAQAFTLNNTIEATFSSDHVPLNVSSENCEHLQLTPHELLDLAYHSAQKFWNRVATSRLRLTRGEVLNLDDDFRDGPLCTSFSSSGACTINENLVGPEGITIFCNRNSDNFPPPGQTLGLSLPNNINGNKITGSIIALNDRPNSLLPTLNSAELKAVLAHEIGHAFGLGHSPVTDSLMYYALVPTRERLGQDDILAVSYLYPRQQGITCGTVKNIHEIPPSSALLLIFLLGFFLLIIQKNRTSKRPV